MAALHRRRDELAAALDRMASTEAEAESAMTRAEDGFARDASRADELDAAEKSLRQCRATIAATRRRLADLDALLISPEYADRARALDEASARAGTVTDLLHDVAPVLAAIEAHGKSLAEAWGALNAALETRICAWSEAAHLADDLSAPKPAQPADQRDLRINFRRALAQGLRSGGLEPMSETVFDLLQVHQVDLPR
jgi:ABC-type transporter Mla subunit MlaD